MPFGAAQGRLGWRAMQTSDIGAKTPVRCADITRSAWLTAGNALQWQNIEKALEGPRPCGPPLDVSPLFEPAIPIGGSSRGPVALPLQAELRYAPSRASLTECSTECPAAPPLADRSISSSGSRLRSNTCTKSSFSLKWKLNEALRIV